MADIKINLDPGALGDPVPVPLPDPVPADEPKTDDDKTARLAELAKMNTVPVGVDVYPTGSREAQAAGISDPGNASQFLRDWAKRLDGFKECDVSAFSTIQESEAFTGDQHNADGAWSEEVAKAPGQVKAITGAIVITIKF